MTDKIDRVVLNRWLGLPIFLAIMLLIFWLTFGWSAPGSATCCLLASIP